jgi:predicted RNA binding protein YcfA (HicA-like mRNA interferase family)
LRLPRGVTGRDLAGSLARLGYVVDRQTGSHIRLTTRRGGEHHITVPDHDPIRPGTLSAILRDVGAHAKLPREELLRLLFE